ncbi:MAG: NUDIX domain-containing protein [Polyangiales bacterium]
MTLPAHPDAMPASWRRALRDATERSPAQPRVGLRRSTDGALIGSIERGLLSEMRAARLPLTGETAAGVALDAAPDIALAALAGWLRARSSRWREEPLDVLDAEGHALATVARDAARPLGITTRAVHLLGHTDDGRVWLQQRANDKPTDPNAWDTLVGGLVSAGESLTTALARETWEEAGLDLHALRALRHLGRVWIRRPVPEGLQVQHIEVFDARLDDTQRPENRDGEVQGFACVSREALAARLLDGVFTLEAALAFDHGWSALFAASPAAAGAAPHEPPRS